MSVLLLFLAVSVGLAPWAGGWSLLFAFALVVVLLLCGAKYGGHEDNGSLPTGPYTGIGCCPRCKDRAKKISDAYYGNLKTTRVFGENGEELEIRHEEGVSLEEAWREGS